MKKYNCVERNTAEYWEKYYFKTLGNPKVSIDLIGDRVKKWF